MGRNHSARRSLAHLRGAGARVRWYEIVPSNASLFQTGNITGEATGVSKCYVINGAISPDRAVVSGTGLFGSNQKPDIRMASKVGTNPTEVQSTPIKVSPFALKDFTCSSKFCRWGDYAAATPDPNPPVGTSGQVWLTNQFVENNGNSGAGWGSRNWAATP